MIVQDLEIKFEALSAQEQAVDGGCCYDYDCDYDYDYDYCDKPDPCKPEKPKCEPKKPEYSWCVPVTYCYTPKKYKC